MAGLAGLGVGEAVGGVTGALIGMGIPEFEAKRYKGRLQKGEILLSVHCDTVEEIKRAKEVLKSAGERTFPPRESLLSMSRRQTATWPVRLRVELASPRGGSRLTASSSSVLGNWFGESKLHSSDK
jgi:hypothetical protein